MTLDEEQAAMIEQAVDTIHEHWRDWDRQLWQWFVDGNDTPINRNIILDVPDLVRRHPRFEDYQPGDEAARLDVASGAYEAVRTINDEDIVLDVGAHIGHFTEKALDAGARVTAIEPDPRNVRMLGRLLMRWPNHLTIYPVAAGLHAQALTLRRSVFSSQNRLAGQPTAARQASEESLAAITRGPAPVNVACVALDDLLLRPTFIKIDVEEAELAVLHGLNDTIIDCAPFIAIEVTADMDACATFLRSRGYRIKCQEHMHTGPLGMDVPMPGLWHCTPE